MSSSPYQSSPLDEEIPDLSAARKGMIKAIKAALNSHGLAFQCRALQEAKRAHESGASRWIFETAEVPVSVRSRNTHIDFVLRHERLPWYLVIECKRSHPSFSRWAFARFPITRRNHASDSLHIDLAFVSDMADGECVVESRKTWSQVAPLYHTAFAIKAAGSIEEDWECPTNDRERLAPTLAIDQAVRGVNGLINHWHAHGVQRSGTRFILPLVVTTAELWGVDANLSAADLRTGNIDVTETDLCNHQWVCVEQRTSSELKHDARSFIPDGELGIETDALFTRSCPVVNALHFARFLEFLSEDTWLDVGILSQSQAPGRVTPGRSRDA